MFLDRDGVLNRLVRDEDGVERPPRGPGALELLPGTEQACARLKERGFALIVATNQPDVARGRLAREAVEAVNDALQARLPLDEILVCYHDDADDCACRKPRPGLLLDAAARWDLDLAGSFMVGDRDKDVDAGLAAGCTSILVGGGAPGREHHRAASLLEASDWILAGGELG